MSDNNTKIYYFGDFQLDADQRILIRKGEFVKIPPKTFDLLLFFIQNDNKVIDKEHLLNAVWPDSFVEEANLSVHIANLRKLLSASENPAVQIGPSQKGVPSGYRDRNVGTGEPFSGPEVRADEHCGAQSE